MEVSFPLDGVCCDIHRTDDTSLSNQAEKNKMVNDSNGSEVTGNLQNYSNSATINTLKSINSIRAKSWDSVDVNGGGANNPSNDAYLGRSSFTLLTPGV